MRIVFSLDQIIVAISEKKCLICNEDLNFILGKEGNLPLCNIHRKKYLLGELEGYE